MSIYEPLQVFEEYRAGAHRFVTVGTSSNLGDALLDQIDNVHQEVLTIIGDKVGIGTFSPQAKTHLYIDSQNDSNTHALLIESNLTESNVLLVVQNDGNLGIGTSIALHKLHVEGSSITMGNVGIGTSTMAVKFEVHSTDAMLLPKGVTDERPIEGVAGYIRYNTTTSTFEGYGAGDAWGSLGGVKDTNQDTYISAELYPGSNDDALRFVTCNVQRMTIDSYGNVGVGTSTMAVKFEVHSTDAMLLPKGVTDERPIEGVTGYIRYNTTTSTFEGYGAGDAWGSLGGVKDTNQDTYISAELYPGSNDDALRFVTCNVQRMTIDSYGNVGIGTSTMSSLVDIYGATTSIAPVVTINQQGTGTILDVQDGGVSAFIVVDGGNVGIGLTEPMDTLHVDGGIISTNTQTSNLTIWNSLNIPMTSTNIRTRVQVHHIRKTFYVDAPTQSDFEVTYPGAFSGHQSNVQVSLGRDQLSYISPTIKDYDLTLTYLMEQQVTEYTISLTTPAVYGDIVDIIVWPQITQNSPEEQGIVYQSVLVNDSYWLEQGKTIPVRNTVPIYVLGNVGIGTTMPLEKLDIYGNVQVNGGVSITGNVLITGDIVPSACNMYNLGASNLRFKDLFLSGNTIDLGGTLISRDESETGGGGIKVTSDTGEAVDTTVRNLFALGNIGIGLSNPQARLDIDGGIKLAGHIIPSANVAFDLGSSGARFRDLYLSGNTLDLGGTLLKRHVTGPLMVMSEATQSMESIIGRHAYIEGTANACNVIISTNGTGTSLLVKQESQGQAVVDFQAITDYQSSLKSVFLINNNGLVGIGTTLPQEACHVEGNSLVNGTVISSNVSINTNGTGTSLVINQKGSEAIANFQSNGTSVMFVEQTGHVGINTALPAEALHVKGSALVNGVIYTSNIQITSGGEGMPLFVNQIGEHPIAEFQSMGSSVLLVKQTGRVGINTSLPAEALHVEGNVVASGTITASNLVILGDYVTLDTITSNTEQMVITNDGTGPALIVTQTGPEPIADFYDDGGVLALRIADGGNVGIGTRTPLQKLHVNGALRGTQLISTIATGTEPLTVASTTKVTNLNADLLDDLDSTKFMRTDTNTSTTGTITGTRLISTVATGSEPLTITSTTKVTNLNADLLDDLDSTKFMRTDTNTSTTGTITGTRFISTVATGTEPLTITSTTKVTNLNADLLDGLDNTKFVRTDGSSTISSATDTIFTVQTTNDANKAEIAVYGPGQGTGRVYVGQSSSYGGGLEYNGDNIPTTTGAGADYITLFRRDNGVDSWTARNIYYTNDWEFNGYVSKPNNVYCQVGKNNGDIPINTFIVFNHVIIDNRGIYNTSNGRFTAPIAGHYMFCFTCLGAINTSTPNTRWYKNGAETGYGAAHVNNANLSNTHIGLSTQMIIYLNAGDYVQHMSVSSTMYGSSSLHCHQLCILLG